MLYLLTLMQAYVGAPLDQMRFASLPSDINSRLLNVSSVIQDHMGYLWFGSQDGLYRYDGYQLIGYRNNLDDPYSLADNWVKSLAEDEAGRVWVASREGVLSRLNRASGRFVHYMMEPPGIRIETMLLDRDGYIWLGCERGLARFDPRAESFSWFRHPIDQSRDADNITLSIIQDSTGQIWAGYGGGGICRVDAVKGCVEHIDVPLIDARFADRQIWCGLEVGPKIWFGSSHGIYVFEPESRSFETMVPERFGDSRVRITRMMKDTDGRIWIGTRMFGVCVYQDGVVSYSALKPGRAGGLPHSYVRSIFQDRSGIVWIGTLSGGVSKFDVNTPQFQLIDRDQGGNGLCGSFVKGIHLDRGGHLWVGGNEGMTRYDMETGESQCFKHAPNDPRSLSSNFVRFFQDDVRGNLWIGTFGGGLNRLDANGEVTRISVQWPEQHLWIDAGYLDGDKLWLGTVGGLICLQTERLAFDRLDLGMVTTGRSRIRSITPGQDHVLYVGSHDGFAVVDRATSTSVLYQHDRRKPDSISNNTVRATFLDSSDRVWVGTSAGLNRFDNGSFEVYGERHGLANEVVYGILEEADTSRLWVSTNAGLSRFDPDLGTFLNYYQDDGLQGSEFNSGASLALMDGRLFFGGTKGVNYFTPQDGRLAVEPLVAINEIKVLDIRYPIQVGLDHVPSLAFDPRQNFLSFEFAALDFSNPTRNLYRYRMVGIDDAWSEPGTRRYVNYPDLVPGTYRFEVMAANSDGVWSSSAAAVDISISPYFYQTAWFVALMFLAAATLIYGRIWALNRQKRVLEDVVSRRTQSLVDSNRELEKANEALKEAQSELVQRAHEAGMAEVAIEVVHNIGNVLNGIGINTEMMKSSLSNSSIDGVHKIWNLLTRHENDLAGFMSNDERGKKLLPYLQRLSEKLRSERASVDGNLDQIAKAVEMMRKTVQMQQDYANKRFEFRERVVVRTIVEDMISLQQSKLAQNQIEINAEYDDVPDLWIQRFKMANVIANLLVNAIDSLIMRDADGKRIDVLVHGDSAGKVVVQISDNGLGFVQGHQDKIFQYGYTTKTMGRGLGLHSCANAMSEMGGSIMAESEGPNRGATFVMTFDPQPPPEVNS